MGWEQMVVIGVPGATPADLEGLDTSGFVQWWDPKADGWIQAAVELSTEAEERRLDGLPYAEQFAGVKKLVTAVSYVFKACNIRWQYDPESWEVWGTEQGPFIPMDETGCSRVLGPSTVGGANAARVDRLRAAVIQAKGSYPTHQDWDTNDPRYAPWQAWRTDPAIAAASEQGRPYPPGPPEPPKVAVYDGMTVIVPCFLNYSSQPVIYDVMDPSAGYLPAGKFDGLFTGSICPRTIPGDPTTTPPTPPPTPGFVVTDPTPGYVVTDPMPGYLDPLQVNPGVRDPSLRRQLGARPMSRPFVCPRKRPAIRGSMGTKPLGSASLPTDRYHAERSDTSIFDWNCFRYDDAPQLVQLLGAPKQLGFRVQQPLRWTFPVLRAIVKRLAARGAQRVIMDTRVRSMLRNLVRAREANLENASDIDVAIIDTLKQLEASKHVSQKDLATLNAATTAICSTVGSVNPLAGAGCGVVGAALGALAQILPLGVGCTYDQWGQPMPSGIEPRIWTKDPDSWTAADHTRYDVPDPPPSQTIVLPSFEERFPVVPLQVRLEALGRMPGPNAPPKVDDVPPDPKVDGSPGPPKGGPPTGQTPDKSAPDTSSKTSTAAKVGAAVGLLYLVFGGL